MNACVDCAAEIELGFKRCLPCARVLADSRGKQDQRPRRPLTDAQRKAIRFRLAGELGVPISLIKGADEASMRAAAEAAAAVEAAS